jgi:hypothetical protein
MPPATSTLLAMGRFQIERMYFVEGPSVAEATEVITSRVIGELITLREKQGYLPVFVVVRPRAVAASCCCRLSAVGMQSVVGLRPLISARVEWQRLLLCAGWRLWL